MCTEGVKCLLPKQERLCSSYCAFTLPHVERFSNSLYMLFQIHVLQFVIDAYINKIWHIRIIHLIRKMQQIIVGKSFIGVQSNIYIASGVVCSFCTAAVYRYSFYAGMFFEQCV